MAKISKINFFLVWLFGVGGGQRDITKDIYDLPLAVVEEININIPVNIVVPKKFKYYNSKYQSIHKKHPKYDFHQCLESCLFREIETDLNLLKLMEQKYKKCKIQNTKKQKHKHKQI